MLKGQFNIYASFLISLSGFNFQPLFFSFLFFFFFFFFFFLISVLLHSL